MKLMMLAASAALVTTMAVAQGGAQTVRGTLMDNSCANPKMTGAELAGHGKDCLQMDDCEQSGYAVVTAANQIILLDAKGNAMAKAQIAASAKKNDFKVTVAGAVKDGVIAVSSLSIDK